MRATLAAHLSDAVRDILQFKEGVMDYDALMSWCDQYEAQIVVLAAQIQWTKNVEAILKSASSAADKLASLKRVLKHLETTLAVLADSVLQPALRRRKLEHLNNEFVHKRTVTRSLIESNVFNPLNGL